MRVVEDLLKLAEEISDLRRVLKEKESEFARRLARSKVTEATLAASGVDVSEKIDLGQAKAEVANAAAASSTGQLKALLQSEPGRIFTITEMAKHLKDVKITTLRATMSRLARDRKKTRIQCVGYGMYKYLPEESR